MGEKKLPPHSVDKTCEHVWVTTFQGLHSQKLPFCCLTQQVVWILVTKLQLPKRAAGAHDIAVKRRSSEAFAESSSTIMAGPKLKACARLCASTRSLVKQKVCELKGHGSGQALTQQHTSHCAELQAEAH